MKAFKSQREPIGIVSPWGYVGHPPHLPPHKIKVSECVVRVSEAVEIEIRRPNSPAKANI